MNRAELEDAFLKVAPLDVLDSRQQSEVEELLRHPGLQHIYGLMLGERQGLYAALSNFPMTNMETVAAASVLQGRIKGIESFRSTLLELTVPNGEEQKES